MRDYPPAHIIHEATCEDAPTGLQAFSARRLQTLPNSRPHSCFTSATVTFDRDVVAEPGEYERHPYKPSTIHPDDAVRALCETCRGTHGDEIDLRQFLGLTP